MPRGRGRKLKAVFADGSATYSDITKGFTHAWRVSGTKDGKPEAVNGWARSERLAQMAADAHAGGAKSWRDITVEIVAGQLP